MQLGYIGLGKMGKNMALRLVEKGHNLTVWNRSPEPRQELAAAGATAVETIENLVAALDGQKTIWLMLPAGEVTNSTIATLADLLKPEDIIIDGANSNFKDTQKNSQLLKEKNIHFLDAGVSGGPAGAREGACLMIGGDEAVFQQLESLFKDIAAPDGYRFFSGAGAGHFVKMVHNGIEYGMMQAIGEGFEVLQKSEFQLDLKKVSEIYNSRSVIESRLIGWLDAAFAEHSQELNGISGEVSHSGEGQWTVETAKAMQIPVPVIEAALQFRLDSEGNPSYTGQVVSALRNQFGGHEVEDTK